MKGSKQKKRQYFAFAKTDIRRSAIIKSTTFNMDAKPKAKPTIIPINTFQCIDTIEFR